MQYKSPKLGDVISKEHLEAIALLEKISGDKDLKQKLDKVISLLSTIKDWHNM